jgi:hypothetical protein
VTTSNGVITKIINTTKTKIMKGISYKITFLLMEIGTIIETIHRMRKILEILLPKTFAIARLVFPCKADWIFTTSSGVDVHKATIVSQIINSEIPSLLAT